MPPDPVAVTLQVVDALEALGIADRRSNER